jgi:aspartokinase-like uncharacterized kinase
LIVESHALRAGARPALAADEVRPIVVKLGGSVVRSPELPAAHRMALLAMDQLAWAVAGLRQGLEVGATEADLRAALERGSVAVWAPYALIAERTDIEDSWRLTSDSLALWLASRVGASRCYLIKSILRQQKRLGAEQLARDGIVDEAFPSMLKDARVPSFLLGRGDQQAFASALAQPGCAESCGAEID